MPEFCYYAIPFGEDVLALLGADSMEHYGCHKRGKLYSSKHFHNLMEIGICRWGRGEIIVNNRNYHYEKGCSVVIPKNVPHAIVSEEEDSFWEYLYLNPSLFLQNKGLVEKRERKNYLDLIEQKPIFKKDGEAPFLVSEVNLLMDQIRLQEHGYLQCVRGLLYSLLMEIVKINHSSEPGRKYPVWHGIDTSGKITRALDYIDEHYAGKIRAEDIAKSAFISTNYLRKLFHDCFMMSPMQYVNYIRIQEACKLLRKTDHNINEVARKVGYDNLSTFINNFKVYMGETPKQWKEKQLNPRP